MLMKGRYLELVGHDKNSKKRKISEKDKSLCYL